MFFRRKKQRRALVLGLDGVPKGLIERFSQDGTMPFLGEVFKNGALHQVRVTLPEVSSVNWSSFMTGANPGEHGIFGFTDLRPGTYRMTFPAFTDLQRDTLWDELGRMGKRCLVINQPACYPARDIPGTLVSGFVAVDLKRAVSPSSELGPLETMHYKIDVDTRAAKDNADTLFSELEQCLASREAAARHFFDKETWDFAEVVITGTDRLQHFYWPSCTGNGPEQARAQAYYRHCDDLLRRLVERFYGKDDPEGLFLLSDHGFTEIQTEFYINAWLEQEGYLTFENDPPESYADVAASARLFALDPGRIYLHRKGRFPKGQQEDEAVLDEVKAKLEALEWEGQPVAERVWKRDELYRGPQTPLGPDLVVTPRRGVDIKGAIKKKEPFGRSHFTGMHTWDDAFFWASKDCGRDLCISDLRTHIVAHMGDGQG